jgi:hypothetical protein
MGAPPLKEQQAHHVPEDRQDPDEDQNPTDRPVPPLRQAVRAEEYYAGGEDEDPRVEAAAEQDHDRPGDEEETGQQQQ